MANAIAKSPELAAHRVEKARRSITLYTGTLIYVSGSTQQLRLAHPVKVEIVPDKPDDGARDPNA